MALAWGSRSTRSVGRSATARALARLTAVVVFPTPPFWFTTAMLRVAARSCSTWNVRVPLRPADYKKLAPPGQFPRQGRATTSRCAPRRGRAAGGPSDTHEHPIGGQERRGQRLGRRAGRHGPHGDRAEAPGQRPTRQRLGTAPVDLDAREAELPDHVPQEVRAPARRIDQDDLPVRPRELQDQTRDARARPDVEERRGAARAARPAASGIRPRGAGPRRRAVAVGRQAPIRSQRSSSSRYVAIWAGKAGGRASPSAARGRAAESARASPGAEVARRARARGRRSGSARLRLGGLARSSHCDRSGTAGGWTGSC